MRNRLVLQYPASWRGATWRDARPTGNGVLGAAVYGAGRIAVLPALPAAWAQGSFTGLLARGGGEVSIVWGGDEQSVEVRLCSKGRDQTVELWLGATKQRTVELMANISLSLTLKPLKMSEP